MTLKTKACNPYTDFDDNKRTAICVTTNGMISRNGRAVMGAGVAKFVRDNFKDIDLKLADYLEKYGNRVFNLGKQTHNGKEFFLFSYPTKHDWKDNSDLDLIKTSAEQTVSLANKLKIDTVLLPAPGCTNGKLDWSKVEKIISPIFRDSDFNTIITSLDKKTFQKNTINYSM